MPHHETQLSGWPMPHTLIPAFLRHACNTGTENQAALRLPPQIRGMIDGAIT